MLSSPPGRTPSSGVRLEPPDPLPVAGSHVRAGTYSPFAVALLAAFLTGLPGGTAGAQVTPLEDRIYPRAAFTGPCYRQRIPNDGQVGTVHGSTFVATYFRFRSGTRVATVSPPGCIPAELPPGEYERLTRGSSHRNRNYCVYANQPADDCTEQDSERIEEKAWEQGPIPFTVSDDCRTFAGTVAYARGEVRDADGNAIEEGDPVQFGDEIRTGSGVVEIRNERGDAFRVGRNSILRSHEWDCVPEAPDRGISASWVLGRIWSWMAGEGTVETVTALNGVRGTVFLVESSEAEGQPFSATWVLEGEVEVWNRADSDSSVLVRAGEWTRVVGLQPPTPPEPFDRVDLEARAEEDGVSLPPRP